MLNRICLLIAFLITGLSLQAQQDSIQPQSVGTQKPDTIQTTQEPSVTSPQDTVLLATPHRLMDYSEQKEYTIQGVTVAGTEYTNPTVIISMSGLIVGKTITIPGEAIAKIIEKFWNQGLYSDVKIVAKKIEGDNIWLEIRLAERHRLSSFNIKGVRKGEVQDLKEKLNIKPGNQLNDNVLNTITNVIKKHYREKGYLNATVTFSQVDDTVYKNRVALTAYVDKKSKIKIAKIIFTGNELYSDKRLRRTLKKTKQWDLNIFTGAKFNEEKFKEDKGKLHDFYKKNGYRDFKYISDSINFVSESRIKLYISIYEGKKYYLRNITWIGNTKYPSDFLSRVLVLKKGDVYDQVAFDKRLSSDEDAVTSLYLDNGYLFSNITPVEIPVGEDSIDIEMRVTEGRQANINRIIINGNEKTNEHVVRRELRTHPGDLFSKAAIIRSIRDLSQLGFFNPEKIQPVPIPNPSDGTVDIQYTLEEKSSDQLEVSGGWGADMLVGTIGLRFNNFSSRKIFKPRAWRPVPTGDGQSLSLRAQSNGSYYKAYSMSFTEPWFGGKKPNSFSFSLYYNVQNSSSTGLLESSDKSFKVGGISVGLGRRLSWPDDNFTLYNEVSYQSYKLTNWYSGNFIFTNGVSRNISFKTQFGRSTTDQPIYPRGGSQFSISLQITPPYSLFRKKDFWKVSSEERNNLTEEEIYNTEQAHKYKLIEYHKWNFKAVWYNKVYKDMVLSIGTQFGYLGYFSKNLGYSPFEGFVLGGDGFSGYSLYGKETIGLRGYENESLTATIPNYYYQNGVKQNYSTQVSNIYQKATIELRYPISLQPSATIYGLVFLEAGNSWYDFKKFNPFAMKRSAGFGLRAFLPMFGLLGIDWGYGFDPMPGYTKPSGGQFHFVMGQQF
jgi:outer membrane protein insertion porin family